MEETLSANHPLDVYVKKEKWTDDSSKHPDQI